MRKIELLLILFIYFFDIQAQNVVFNHMDVQDGLSQSTVQSIYQDEYGQMWFATRNGLNKYNGNVIQRVA